MEQCIHFALQHMELFFLFFAPFAGANNINSCFDRIYDDSTLK